MRIENNFSQIYIPTLTSNHTHRLCEQQSGSRHSYQAWSTHPRKNPQLNILNKIILPSCTHAQRGHWAWSNIRMLPCHCVRSKVYHMLQVRLRNKRSNDTRADKLAMRRNAATDVPYESEAHSGSEEY